MSHRATNWAIQQSGLMPATKLVLWYLCDRHTPDFGCYPSQDQLATDAEISRASLNTHLRKLEEAGLIRRHRRSEQGTKQRKSTRYILGFEEDFAEKPCPDSGHGNGQKPCPNLKQKGEKPCPNPRQSHVQILDTNLVRKKETTTGRTAHASTHDTHAKEAPEAACLAVCGEGLCAEARAVILATAPVIDGWLSAGYDLDADILPVLRARTLRRRDSPIRTWAYFTMAIAKRHTQRTALAAKAKSAGEVKQTARPTEYEMLVQAAGWINSGGFVPPSAVSTSKRAALLAAGLVTEATLRARQIY